MNLPYFSLANLSFLTGEPDMTPVMNGGKISLSLLLFYLFRCVYACACASWGQGLDSYLVTQEERQAREPEDELKGKKSRVLGQEAWRQGC